eukprot:5812982-Alexandrium_andersonii.AAC.1
MFVRSALIFDVRSWTRGMRVSSAAIEMLNVDFCASNFKTQAAAGSRARKCRLAESFGLESGWCPK